MAMTLVGGILGENSTKHVGFKEFTRLREIKLIIGKGILCL